MRRPEVCPLQMRPHEECPLQMRLPEVCPLQMRLEVCPLKMRPIHPCLGEKAPQEIEALQIGRPQVDFRSGKPCPVDRHQFAERLCRPLHVRTGGLERARPTGEFLERHIVWMDAVFFVNLICVQTGSVLGVCLKRQIKFAWMLFCRHVAAEFTDIDGKQACNTRGFAGPLFDQTEKAVYRGAAGDDVVLPFGEDGLGSFFAQDRPGDLASCRKIIEGGCEFVIEERGGGQVDRPLRHHRSPDQEGRAEQADEQGACSKAGAGFRESLPVGRDQDGKDRADCQQEDCRGHHQPEQGRECRASLAA
jgi:hypothetical protein